MKHMKLKDIIGNLNVYNKIVLLINNGEEEVVLQNKYEIDNKYFDCDLYCIGISHEHNALLISIWQ